MYNPNEMSTNLPQGKQIRKSSHSPSANGRTAFNAGLTTVQRAATRSLYGQQVRSTASSPVIKTNALYLANSDNTSARKSDSFRKRVSKRNHVFLQNNGDNDCPLFYGYSSPEYTLTSDVAKFLDVILNATRNKRWEALPKAAINKWCTKYRN